MSARFVTNFVVLLAGAGLLVACFAFSADTAGWVSVGAGATAILAGLWDFALPRRGVYQRLADVAMCFVGVWAIVAALVLSDDSRWRVFSAGAALAGLGAAGLVVRELELHRGLKVDDERIGADRLTEPSAMQRRAGVRP